MTDEMMEQACISWLAQRGYTVTKGSVPYVSSPVTDPFDTFWELYPRRPRDGKANARKAFDKAGLSVTVLSGLHAWLDIGAFNTDPKYIPHASTWLNQKCYLDEPEPYKGFKKPQIGGTSPKRNALDDWLENG